MKLNKNNYLIWDGQFADAPFQTVVNGWVLSLVQGESYVEGQVLFDDFATYGINLSTFEFTVQDNPTTPATWDSVTGMVKYYPPAGVTPGLRYLKYKWKDNMGHDSPEGTITISVLARATAWRPAASSYQCQLSGGVNTGMAYYSLLEKYYTDNGTAYSPYTTKPNTVGDPDYVAPVADGATCPVPGSTISVNVWNFVDVVGPYISRVRFDNGAGTVVEISPDLHRSDPQPVTFTVPSGTYTVTVTVYDGNGFSVDISGGGTQLISGNPGNAVFFGYTPTAPGVDISLN